MRFRDGPLQKNRATDYERADDHNFHDHQRTLHGAASADSETINERENSQRNGCESATGDWNVRQLDEIFSERDGYRSHAAGLNDQQ